MKFKLDENLPLASADVFNQAGHDASSVYEQALTGSPDDKLVQICREEERVLVTLDLDFSDIRAYPPDRYSGIIVLRLQHQDAHAVMDVCRRLLPVIEQEPLNGRLWIVDERRVRIRE